MISWSNLGVLEEEQRWFESGDDLKGPVRRDGDAEWQLRQPWQCWRHIQRQPRGAWQSERATLRDQGNSAHPRADATFEAPCQQNYIRWMDVLNTEDRSTFRIVCSKIFVFGTALARTRKGEKCYGEFPSWQTRESKSSTGPNGSKSIGYSKRLINSK